VSIFIDSAVAHGILNLAITRIIDFAKSAEGVNFTDFSLYRIAITQDPLPKTTTKKVAGAPKKSTVKKFEKPTTQDLIKYFAERNSDDPLDQANRFFDYFESKGWMVGKTPMKDWKAAVRNWMRNNFSTGKPNQPKIEQPETDAERSARYDDIGRMVEEGLRNDR